jgi:ABC-type sulfate transport system substrate-binding protein
VVVERNVTPDEKDLVFAFRNFLWSDEAQKAFVKNHFRSVTNDAFNEANPEFARIELPFTVDYFGGWAKAYPDIIEGIFQKQVKGN